MVRWLILFFTLSVVTPGLTLEIGDEFKDCDECPTMVVVPSGSFVMGSPENEKWRFDDEGPQHKVTISAPFAVGKFEATQEEWNACVVDGPCIPAISNEDRGRGKEPVTNVTWHEVKTYISWLSVKTGKRYRLLSEAEWEYAARAGSTEARHWGESIVNGCVYANGFDPAASGKYSGWLEANCDDGQIRAAPVGSFRPNAFGLYDTLGNALEWTEDCWVYSFPGGTSYDGAPADGSTSTCGNCSYHMVRGGSWNSYPRALRSAFRGQYAAYDRYSALGFRVAKTLN